MRRIVVPNSMMSSDYIVNWSLGDPESIWPVDFGIGYTSDIDKARSIIIEEIKKASSHIERQRDQRPPHKTG